MNLVRVDRNLSFSSEVRDGNAVNPYIFCSRKSFPDGVSPLIRRDHEIAFEGGSIKTNSRRFDLRGNSANSDKTFLHGIQDIEPLPANCGSKNLNMLAAKKKKNVGFYRGLGLSFWTADVSGISSNKGTELCDEDVNLSISGKTTKVPQEHTDIDGFHFQIETDSPSDTGTTQDNSSTSPQTISNTGKPAVQVSIIQTGSNNFSHSSSSSSGGDDGDDGRRQNVPVGSCQQDSQYSVDNSEEHEQQPEENSNQDGDPLHNQDSMSIPMSVPSDTGNSQDKTGTLNQKVGQTPTDEGKPAEQASRTQEGSTSDQHISSDSGGDDGEEDRKPSEAETTQENSGDSGQKGSQAAPHTDKPAAQVSKSPGGSNNFCCSSSGIGGGEDNGDDGPRQNVPPGGCQGDNSVDGSEEHKQQPEEQNHQGGDCPHNRDSMSTCTPTKVPSGTGNSKEKTSASNQKVGQTAKDEGKPAGQISKTQQGNTSYRGSSSGSGGDDGGEDRKHKLSTGGCQDDSWCEVDELGETKPREQDNDQEQFNCHHPEADLHEAGQRLQQAFTCRRRLNSENEWKECAEACCREIQEYFSHTQNCRMRVLGGCKKCIWYKEVLIYHASRCHPPMGACVVQRCDTIRQYMKKNRIPDNRKWPYQLDNTFFSPSPPACIPDIGQDRGEVIWPLDQRVLSVGEDGSYVEGVHWRRVKHIGRGGSGRCHFCQDAKTEFLFAIKEIPVREFQQMELDTWGSISGQHPNILELYGAVKHREAVVIFMEFMKGGSVKDYGKLDEGLAVHILGKVISAVEFMHSQRLLHRDIKGGNILLDETRQKVKLADFGLAIRCDGYLHDNIPRPKGTEAFLSPEECRSEPYSFSSDIWKLMGTFYQMLVGEHPWREFRHCSPLYQIAKASQPPQPPPCSPEVENLFSQGFVLKPSERATAAKLLRHPLFETGPSVSNIPLPSREEILLGKDALRSESGSCNDDQEEEMNNEHDKDSDNEASDGYDDSSRDMLEPDNLVVEAAIEEPWQGRDFPAEAQRQSFQSDLLLSVEGQDLERVLTELEEDTDVNDNDINLLTGGDSDVGQFIGSLLRDANMSSTQSPSDA